MPLRAATVLAVLTLSLSALPAVTRAEGSLTLSAGQTRYAQWPSDNAVSSDSSTAALKASLSTALSPHVGITAGLASLGKVSAATPAGPDKEQRREMELAGPFAGLRWQWRPGEAWRPYAKMDVFYARSHLLLHELDLTNGLETSNGDSHRNSFVKVPGIGVMFEPSATFWGLQLELEDYLGIKTPLSQADVDVVALTAGAYFYW